MRSFMLAILAAFAAVTGGACTDYFQGTTLVFEFDGLAELHRIQDKDKYSASTGVGELCADDAYVALDPEALDNVGNPWQLPYEYHAWATINGGPVRLARFSVRECTVNSGDFDLKPAITTVSYSREPTYLSANPEDGSRWYGAVNYVQAPLVSGSATMTTDVRLDQATEIFVTREAEGVSEDLGPEGTLLMLGTLRRENQVFTATMAKVTGTASGLVTAIPADRVSAW